MGPQRDEIGHSLGSDVTGGFRRVRLFLHARSERQVEERSFPCKAAPCPVSSRLFSSPPIMLGRLEGAAGFCPPSAQWAN